jgi:hypothetical protein
VQINKKYPPPKRKANTLQKQDLNKGRLSMKKAYLNQKLNGIKD